MQTKSFTLIELLVVIVIIGILAGVITLSVSSNIAKAQDTKISASILSLNKILKTESILSFPIEATPCNLKDSCTNLKSKIDIPKIEDDIYYVTSASGNYFALFAKKKSDPYLGFKIDSNEESVFEATVDSRDNNSYRVVRIGNQIWTAENSKYLPSVVGPATVSETVPYYYIYDYDGTDVTTAKAQANYKTYGVLYNWKAATTACPIGWHLPSDNEYKTLEKYLGMTEADANATDWRYSGDVGTKLKDGGSSNFNALMAGLCINGSFYYISYTTTLWASDPSSTSAWRRDSDLGLTAVNRGTDLKVNGFSVRCIID